MTLIVNKLMSEGKGSKIRQEFAGTTQYGTVQYSTVQYSREVRNAGTISPHCGQVLVLGAGGRLNNRINNL